MQGAFIWLSHLCHWRVMNGIGGIGESSLVFMNKYVPFSRQLAYS